MKLRTNSSHRGLILSVAALSLAAAGHAQFGGPALTSPPQPAGAPAAAMNAVHREMKIAPGDIIAISTLGVPELTTTAQTSSGGIAFGSNSATMQGIKVGSAGEVLLPYLGAVKLAGLTPTQAAALLSNALKQAGILVDPQVSVELVDSPTRAITVLGEVMKPSPVPAFGEIRLLDAMSACGGFTPLASHQVTVRRVGQSDPITVELGTGSQDAAAADIPLMPGDTVIVSKVGSVFVLGYVKLPAAIPLAGNAPITVLRALTLVGGVNYGAALSKARIIRTTADNQRVEIRLDLKKIMFGQQQDVVLLSNDILLVPANAFKAGMAAGGAGVAASLLYAASDTATIFK